MTDLPCVGIVLCTYNGAQFLRAQLDSIARQSHQNWKLYISDDGSQDQTLAIISQFANEYPQDQITIFFGPQRGFSNNFLSVLIRPELQQEFIAFSDQDDVWLENKLETALLSLRDSSRDVPTMHCSRTRYINESDQVIGDSTLFTKPPSFANALVQSIGGGNTMMINKAALEFLRPIALTQEIFSHDWWIYLVVSALNGKVIYEPKPLVLYRQHSRNVMGMNTTLSQKWRRIKMLWSGDFRRWNDLNIATLKPLYSQMSQSIRYSFDHFSLGRHQAFWLRLLMLKRSGIYRQTFLGNMGLLFAALFNKI